jgi:hypothetical protein
LGSGRTRRRRMFRRLSVFIHKALCFVGIHATELIYVFDADADDFVVDGSFCPVCDNIGGRYAKL